MSRREQSWPQLAWGIGYVVIGAAIAVAIAWPIYQSPRTIVIVSLSGKVSSGAASWFGCTACPLNVREQPTHATTTTTHA